MSSHGKRDKPALLDLFYRGVNTIYKDRVLNTQLLPRTPPLNTVTRRGRISAQESGSGRNKLSDHGRTDISLGGMEGMGEEISMF
jgi:hypothetical protein